MSKVIMVWGRKNAGKTVFAVNLALQLAQSGVVGIISSNLQYGELQVVFGQKIDADKGLFKCLESNMAAIKDCFIQSEKSKNLFYLTLPNRHNALLLQEVEGETTQRLIETAAIYFDYLIIDGNEELNNPISGMGLSMADIVFVLYKPDNATCNWQHSVEEVIRQLRIKEKLVPVINGYWGLVPKESFCQICGITPRFELACVPDCEFWWNNGLTVYEKTGKDTKAYKEVLSKMGELVVSGHVQH